MRAGDIILEKSNKPFINLIKALFGVNNVEYYAVIEIEGKTLLLKTTLFNTLSITPATDFTGNITTYVPKKDYNKEERDQFSRTAVNLLEINAIMTDSKTLIKLLSNSVRPDTIKDDSNTLLKYYVTIENKVRRLIKK